MGRRKFCVNAPALLVFKYQATREQHLAAPLSASPPQTQHDSLLRQAPKPLPFYMDKIVALQFDNSSNSQC
jgi:hypothetical protein